MAWAEIARRQGGIITTRQLVDAGVSPHVVDQMQRALALEPMTRGVYRARGAPDTYLARIWAAVLATDAVAGFATAAHLWGVEDTAPPKIELVIAPSRRVTKPLGTRIHHVYTPASCIQEREGLPITTRRQTLLDHLGRLPSARAGRLADRALQRGWITVGDIDRRLQDYPGRQGNRMLRDLRTHCEDGAAAESERRLHRILRAAGLRGWKPNYAVWHDGQLVAVLDVALPRLKLAIEVDGWAYHSDVDRFQRDRHRQNDLVALGWTVLRFTWADLTQRPGYVASAIRAAASRS